MNQSGSDLRVLQMPSDDTPRHAESGLAPVLTPIQEVLDVMADELYRTAQREGLFDQYDPRPLGVCVRSSRGSSRSCPSDDYRLGKLEEVAEYLQTRAVITVQTRAVNVAFEKLM